jgi:hypothetical protein
LTRASEAYTVAVGGPQDSEEKEVKGAGRVVFAAVFLLIVGTLNALSGIGAVSDADFFVNDTCFMLTNLHTLGWMLIVLG